MIQDSSPQFPESPNENQDPFEAILCRSPLQFSSTFAYCKFSAQPLVYMAGVEFNYVYTFSLNEYEHGVELQNIPVSESLFINKEYLMTLNVFFYVALAAWRLASLVANEDGPWQMFKRFRQRAEQWCNKYKFCRELGLYELVTCEWCNSVWIGAGLTILYLWIGNTILYLALPFAISTVTIVIKYVVQLLQTTQQYIENTNKSHE